MAKDETPDKPIHVIRPLLAEFNEVAEKLKKYRHRNVSKMVLQNTKIGRRTIKVLKNSRSSCN